MEAQLLSYDNAFSFICPGIIDSSLMLVGKDPSVAAHLNHISGWSINSEGKFNCGVANWATHIVVIRPEMNLWFEDALVRFQRGERFARYIPALDWGAVDRTIGMPVIGRHLLPITEEELVDSQTDIIRNVLGIRPADFSSDTPLTTYGIDSLSAARISFMLRPMIEVTQLQLLADISFNDLLKKLENPATPQAEERSKPLKAVDKARTMMRLLDRHSKGMKPSSVLSNPGVFTLERIFVVTGTTGALGCNIVHHLLQRREVKKVYALNRKDLQGSSLLSRQMDAFRKQGVPQHVARSAKLVLVECDLRELDLGIDRSLRHKVCPVLILSG